LIRKCHERDESCWIDHTDKRLQQEWSKEISMTLILVIGNKNYSSWSMRPWIAMRAAGLSFTEKLIPLGQDGSAAQLQAVSPTGRVPVLIDGDLMIPESLAILEYVAEIAPEAKLLPVERTARAMCRAVATEMHGGFQAIRGHCPMNLSRVNKPRASGLTPAVEADIARITTIWNACRQRFGAGGPFLFGHFTLADAMFAPVVTRFVSYALPRDAVSEAYMTSILSHPAFLDWKSDAAKENHAYPATDGVD
jgi:glutathione S-transferase